MEPQGRVRTPSSVPRSATPPGDSGFGPEQGRLVHRAWDPEGLGLQSWPFFREPQTLAGEVKELPYLLRMLARALHPRAEVAVGKLAVVRLLRAVENL